MATTDRQTDSRYPSSLIQWHPFLSLGEVQCSCSKWADSFHIVVQNPRFSYLWLCPVLPCLANQQQSQENEEGACTFKFHIGSVWRPWQWLHGIMVSKEARRVGETMFLSVYYHHYYYHYIVRGRENLDGVDSSPSHAVYFLLTSLPYEQLLKPWLSVV